MATMVTLDDEDQTKLDAMVRAGQFGSTEEAIHASISLLHDQIVDFSLTASEMAAIRQGLDHEAAGRMIDADEVFDELRARFQNS